MNMKRKDPLAVVGGGCMGIGLAETFLRHDYNVILIVRNEEKISAIREKFENDFGGKILVTNRYEEISGCFLAMEAVTESIPEKQETLNKLSRHLGGGIIASTTSSIPVRILSAFCEDPARFISLHFFNPPVRMKGVEVIAGTETSPATLNASLEFVRSLEKEPVVVKDDPGFVTTRLLMAYFLEAMRMFESGHDPRAIDAAMEKCARMPMGPCAVMDIIGMDCIQNILEILAGEPDWERFHPPSFLKSWVLQGRLGKKSGKGFFSYE